MHGVVRALRMKDPVALAEAAVGFEPEVQQALQLLLRTFGDVSVLDILERELPQNLRFRQLCGKFASWQTSAVPMK